MSRVTDPCLTTTRPVSHHPQAGDGLVEAALSLLRGPHAPRALLLHGNGLGVSALERLGDAMQSDECTTETLVLTQEDVQVCTPAPLHPCNHAHLHTYTPAPLRTCTPAHLRTCSPAHLQACKPAPLHSRALDLGTRAHPVHWPTPA